MYESAICDSNVNPEHKCTHRHIIMVGMEVLVSLARVLLPLLLIVYAVVKKDKTIGALVQMGGLQSRMSNSEALTKSYERVRKEELKLTDKACFTVGVMNVAITPYILGSAPTKFYLLYTPKAVLLILMRWIDFFRQGKQWLLMDFCYWANALVLLYVWVAPTNAALFQTVFLAANGPLAWSMLAFSHSMIFHSYPHITSVFIHASPMLLSFGLRWHSTIKGDFMVCEGLQEAGGVCAVSTSTLVWNALTTLYLPWIICYYFGVFLIMGDYIKRKGFQTLYDRVTTKGPLRPILNAIDPGHPHLKKIVYLLCHLLYGLVTMLVASNMFHSYFAHFSFICTIMTSTAWNGGNFYFNAFSRKQSERLALVAKESQQNHEEKKGK